MPPSPPRSSPALSTHRPLKSSAIPHSAVISTGVGITLHGTRAAFNKLSVFIAMLVVSKTRRAVSSAIARQAFAELNVQASLACFTIRTILKDFRLLKQ